MAARRYSRGRHQRQPRALIHVSWFGWVVIFVIVMVIISRFPGGGG
jgi:hypothetical protein